MLVRALFLLLSVLLLAPAPAWAMAKLYGWAISTSARSAM